MIFINRNPSWRSVVLLASLSMLMLLIGMGVHELRLSDEGLTAAFTQDIVSGGNIFKTRIYGHDAPGFPLYSWCAAICSLGRMPNIFTLRLPTVIAFLVLALNSGLFARRIQSNFAGIIAASVVLTSVMSFRAGLFAHNDILVAALLSSAWYIVYLHGWRRQSWWLCWSVALSLVLLACFGAGAKALVVFYLPFFSMGHRLKSLEALQSRQHLTMFAALLLCIMLWLFLLPEQPFLPWNALAFVEPPDDVSSYFTHLFSMLPKAIFYLLPWSFLAWSPFCLALRQFEADSHCCRFLRTIVLANAVMFWIMPGGSPLHLLPVFGPMAVLIGVHAEIVIRRYQEFFGKVMNYWNIFEFSFALPLCLMYLSMLSGIVVFHDFPMSMALAGLILTVVVSVVLGIMIFMKSLRLSFRSRLIWSVFCCAVLYVVSEGIFQHWRYMRREINGFTLACVKSDYAAELAGDVFSAFKKVPLAKLLEESGTDTVYLSLPTLNSRASMLVEAFYMGCRVQQVGDISKELPEPDECPMLYLLSPFAPADSRREWIAVSDNVMLANWRGILSWEIRSDRKPFVECRVESARMDKAPYGVNEMRLYCGTAGLKSEASAKEEK